MVKPKNMIGKSFGRLVVLEELKERKGGSVCYLCECSCGSLIETKGKYLRNGDTKSCGCLNIEKIKEQGYKNKTHGLSNLKEYAVYKGMVSRCQNKNHDRYHRYGGRGVKVCERWLESFENFYEDMGDRPSSKHQIDRIDNDGDYTPENCRWVTVSENSLNKEFKKGKLNIRNIYKDGNSYYAMVTRQRNTRTSSYNRDLEHVIKLRDLWLKEYEEDEKKWIKDTINNIYKKL